MTDAISPERMFYDLPAIYDQAGMSDYSVMLAERILGYLHQNGWVGRHVLEFGCGTGAAAAYLCQSRMNVTAIDTSPHMLGKATERLEGRGLSIDLVQDDIRVYNAKDKLFDVVFGFNTLSYAPNVMYLSAVFKRANALLKTNKLIVFDMWTIEGLATRLGRRDEVIYDRDGLFVAVQNHFSYDAYRVRQKISFFQTVKEDKIVRGGEEHDLRAYPVTALASLLTKAGFEVRQMLNLDMKPYLPDTDSSERVVVIAEKVQAAAEISSTRS